MNSIFPRLNHYQNYIVPPDSIALTGTPIFPGFQRAKSYDLSRVNQPARSREGGVYVSQRVFQSGEQTKPKRRVRVRTRMHASRRADGSLILHEDVDIPFGVDQRFR